MTNNVLSNDFTKLGIIKYAFPTIFMMIFMSAYIIVDGIFVSNFVNEDALSAINIVYPVITFFTSVGMMLAMGSNAVVAKLLGGGRAEEARGFFTFIYLIVIAVGVLSTVIILFSAKTLVPLLGANEDIFPYGMDYLFYMAPFMTSSFLQIFTQSFFITAGKPSLGFLSCLFGGLANIVLDYVFIAYLDFGIVGAALATGIGFSIPGVFGLVYFAVNRKCDLHFVKPIIDFKRLISSMYNGMGEFVGSLAYALNMFLFNIILMDVAGSNGVASITVILYLQMIQTAIYKGHAYGVSPMISYKFGQQSTEQLKKITSVSMVFISIVSVLTIALSIIFAEFAVNIFISRDSSTFDMAVRGLRLFSLAYITIGFNIYGSAMFTAFSNGKIATIISLCRTFLFFVIAILILPRFLGLDGIWLAVPVAEALTVVIFYIFFKKHRNIYSY